MRVWVDLTNSPHVLVLRPVIERLRARGDEVHVTARDFAQTVGLCRRMGIEATVIGRHRGGHVLDKAAGLAQRSGALVRWARRHGPFDLALGHGSNDVSVAATLLRIPSATMFDYEFATVQHTINGRLARRVDLRLDLRLRGTLQGLGVLRWVDAAIISAEVGVEKPSPGIFHRACERLAVDPSRALHVGDDVGDDLRAAKQAGCHALLWPDEVGSFAALARRLLPRAAVALA